MSEAYVGEIRMFAGDFAPINWAPCDGRTLQINEYEVLYTLLGTTYGGDGRTNFNLPDLRGRLAIGMGQGQNPPLTNRPLAQQAGVETVTLTEANIPAHTHSFAVGSTATSNSPAGGMVPAAVSGFKLYASTATSSALPISKPLLHAAVVSLGSLFQGFPTRSALRLQLSVQE